MKASDLFVRALEAEGVEYIFGIPGEENLDFLNSLKDSKIKLILTRHEQGAGFMAATYGRLTGKTGVCLATLGPGATNFVTAAAYANLGGMPILMITGQKPIKKSKQGRFQIINVVEMMRPITKFSRQIVSANTIPTLVKESIRIAEEERPGAVHLELPEDIAAEETDAELVEINPHRRPTADGYDVDRAIERIEAAERPLLLIGAAANRNLTAQALCEFVDETGIYFFNTQMGKGVIDERNEYFLGTAALSSSDYIHRAIDRADLIINVGHDVIEKPPFFMTKGGVDVIHINNFPANVDEVYFPQVEVVGDIATSIRMIGKGLKENGYSKEMHEGFQNIRQGLQAQILAKSEISRFPMIPQKVVQEIRQMMPDDGILTLDNGVYKIWFARNYPAYEPNTLLLDNALASMGAGLPSALAAKLVNPDKTVVTVCGDGGFMMNSQEMETAVRLGLNVIVVVLRDNAYGMIKWKQTGMGFAEFGLDYGNPDFVKYAESYGAHGYTARSVQDFEKIFKSCLQNEAVHLIDLPVDYSENEKVLIDELKSETQKFLTGEENA